MAETVEAKLDMIARAFDRQRWIAMADAARIVCDACGSRAFPCYPEFKVVCEGPPGSGNLVHIADTGIRSLCAAGSVWHAIAFERGFGGGAGLRAMEGIDGR